MSRATQHATSRLSAHRAAPAGVPVPPAFGRVEDVIDGLAGLEDTLVARRDRRAVFVTAYLVITRTLREWLRKGRFHDRDTVARYVVAFANAYRRALRRYETGPRQRVPEPWRRSFEAARDRRLSLAQDLLLGINAHINYDLPYVIVGVLDLRSRRCYADHVRIDDALAVATPRVRERLASLHGPRVRLAARLYGSAIDDAAARAFRRTRRNAWALARAMALAHRPADVARVRRLIRRRAELAGRLIAAHGRTPAGCLEALAAVDESMPIPPPPARRPTPRARRFGRS